MRSQTGERNGGGSGLGLFKGDSWCFGKVAAEPNQNGRQHEALHNVEEKVQPKK